MPLEERKATYIRTNDGGVKRKYIAGKSARTRWLKQQARFFGVRDEWTEGDGRPRPDWVGPTLSTTE
jgi:hypothetical protein